MAVFDHLMDRFMGPEQLHQVFLRQSVTTPLSGVSATPSMSRIERVPSASESSNASSIEPCSAPGAIPFCVEADTFRSTEAGQKRFDLGSRHSGRVLLPVEKDKVLDPIEARLLGADAIMLQTKLLSD